MRIVDLSMTVEEWDTTPFAPEEAYFKLRPIVRWEDKGFVSNMVEMTVHAGTHIDSPHHFVREHPGVAALPVEHMVSDAVVRLTEGTALPIVITPGLMAGLVTTEGPATGTRPLTEWLAQNAAIVGKRYASEVSRHYRSPVPTSDHPG